MRRFETRDIVRRLGTIGCDDIQLMGLRRRPSSVFNPSIVIEGGITRVFARVSTGYCMYAYGRGYLGYVSAIAELEIPVDSLLSGELNRGKYEASLVVYPSSRYDAWGAEDPRVCEVSGRLWMTYVGRTMEYLWGKRELSVPIAAVEAESEWRKLYVFVLPRTLREGVISDRDSFLMKTRDGRLHLFHRPQMIDGSYYLVVSTVDKLKEAERTIREVEVRETTVVLEPADFEIKLGWACPLVEIGCDSYLALIHAVDKMLHRYRIFAALLEYSERRGFSVVAVSPHYVMEPRELYEVFGDRPHTIFPCGVWRLGDKLLMSYGAADSSAGFAEIDLNEILSVVDSGRLC